MCCVLISHPAQLSLAIPPYVLAVSTTTHVNSALHPSGVAKLSTSFGCGNGRKVTTARWQVTLCDPLWHVIFHSGALISITNYCILTFTLTFSTEGKKWRVWCNCTLLYGLMA